MSAQEILARRMGEVSARKDQERQDVAKLFEKHPDMKAFCMDMKAAFDGDLANFKWADPGPIPGIVDYPAVMESHTAGEKKRGR